MAKSKELKREEALIRQQRLVIVRCIRDIISLQEYYENSKENEFPDGEKTKQCIDSVAEITVQMNDAINELKKHKNIPKDFFADWVGTEPYLSVLKNMDAEILTENQKFLIKMLN